MKNFLATLLIFGLILSGTLQAKPNYKAYGPVKSGETVWRIAYKTRPRGVSRLQMMRAIHKSNPDAFEDGNINLLNKGVKLRIPRTRSMVRNILNSEKQLDVATNTQSDNKTIAVLQKELATVKEELQASRQQLKGLQSLQNQQTGDSKALTATKKALAESEAQVTALKKQNKRLLDANKEPDADKVASLEKELADSKEQLGALKVQNQLLRESSETSLNNSPQDNKQVSETIAALNADIGQLRSRIKELEEIEKLKDAHIAELKKSLDHASSVIKEQTEVNKKIFAELKALKENRESKDNSTESTTAQMEVEEVPETVPAIDESKTTSPVNAVDNTETITIKAGTQASNVDTTEPPVTQAVQHISPKFWLILTLAGLLFVLALLWRMVTAKSDDIA